MISSRIPKYQLEASTQFNQVCKIKCSGLKVTYSLIMNLLTGTFQALFTWESRGHEKSNMLNNLSICRISTMYFDVGSLILKEDLMMLFLLYCYIHLRVLTFSPIPLLRFWGWMTVASKEIHQETQWEASHCAEARGPWVQVWSLKGEAELSMGHSLRTVIKGSKSEAWGPYPRGEVREKVEEHEAR